MTATSRHYYYMHPICSGGETRRASRDNLHSRNFSKLPCLRAIYQALTGLVESWSGVDIRVDHAEVEWSNVWVLRGLEVMLAKIPVITWFH